MASNAKGRALFTALLQGDRPSPISIIYGEEGFLVDEAVSAICRSVLPDGGDDFSLQVFSGGEASGDVIRQSLENLSLFGGQRIIHVRGISSMAVAELDALTPYFDRPAPDTFLLLTDRAIDLRKRFFKAANAASCVNIVEFKPLYQNELPGWVLRRAKGKGLSSFTADLADLLVELIGVELFSLDSALEKLSLFSANNQSRISEQDVFELLDDTRIRTVFELTKTMGERDLDGGVETLIRMLQQGGSAIGLISMIARHFRIVWRVREALERGIRGRALAGEAHCHPMFVSEYERDAKRFTEPALTQIFRHIYDAERSLKSSRLSDQLVLSNLLLEVCL